MPNRFPKKAVPHPPDLLTISEAAEALGACEMSLRRWDASGKFKAHPHPVSGYRL